MIWQKVTYPEAMTLCKMATWMSGG